MRDRWAVFNPSTLTGFLQLVLVVVQSLVRRHADPVHSDLQLLWERLLTANTHTHETDTHT